MQTPVSVDEYQELLESAADLWQPITINFSKTYEKEEEILTKNLDIKFSKRSNYRDPNFRSIKLYAGDRLLDQVEAPFPLIQAYYQKQPLSVMRYQHQTTHREDRVEVAYDVVIRQV